MLFKYFAVMITIFFCSFNLSAAQAQENLRALNGFWVVHYSQTKALWEDSKVDMKNLPLLAALYKLDINFSDATMHEGTSLSSSSPRTPFRIGRDKEGNLLVIVTQDNETRTFTWIMREDGDVLLQQNEAPPFIMMRCDYAQYAGNWALDMPANEPFVSMIANHAKNDSPDKIRAFLRSAKMYLTFSNGDFRMDWLNEQGDRIYRPFPSGTFEVTQYEKNDCTTSQRGMYFTLSFKNNDYIILSNREDNFILHLKRTK